MTTFKTFPAFTVSNKFHQNDTSHKFLKYNRNTFYYNLGHYPLLPHRIQLIIKIFDLL